MRRHLPLLVALGLLVSGITSVAKAEEGKDQPAKDADKKARQKKKTKQKTDKKAEEEGHDLEAWGPVKEVKGNPFFTFAYTKVIGKKATKENIFLKAADDALFFQD